MLTSPQSPIDRSGQSRPSEHVLRGAKSHAANTPSSQMNSRLVMSTVWPFVLYLLLASSLVSAAPARNTWEGKDCSVSIILDKFYLARFNMPDTGRAMILAREEIFGIMRDVNDIYIKHFNVGLPVRNVLEMSDQTSPGDALNYPRSSDEAILDNLVKGIQSRQGVFEAVKDSCVVLLVTHQNLKGRLGSAFGAYTQQNSRNGGVCDKRGFNAGFVTTFFQDGAYDREKIVTTMAHEIGHMYGAPHDGDSPKYPDGPGKLPQCVNKQKPFIMTSTVSGAPNDHSRSFSDCAQWSIKAKLNVASECFVERNSVVYLQYPDGRYQQVAPAAIKKATTPASRKQPASAPAKKQSTPPAKKVVTKPPAAPSQSKKPDPKVSQPQPVQNKPAAQKQTQPKTLPKVMTQKQALNATRT